MNVQSYVSAVCYLITVIAPIAMTAWKSVRKNHFAIRGCICIGAILGINILMTFLIDLLSRMGYEQYGIWSYTAKYIIIFALSMFAVKICFECDWWGALFCANAGYCVQHISARISSLIEETLLKESYFVYKVHWAVATLISMLIAAAVFVCYYFIYVRKIKKNTPLDLTNKSQILIAAFVVGVTVVYNSFGISYASGSIVQAEQNGLSTEHGYKSLIFVYVMSLIIAFLALLLNCGMRNNRRLSGEMDELKQMLDEGKRQYELEKKNIELINIKCHDLKHQLGAMKGKIYEEQIEELKDVIEIYDSSIKVGNEALDVVLTQKSLYCSQHGIRLTCLLNGNNYDFIPRHELYTLFTNVIDNAIEAVEKLPEEKRVISITERQTKGFLAVRAENYYSGKVEFAGELPVSSKGNSEHGFGVKSMKLIAEKYGGGIAVNADGERFTLDIFFLMS